MDVVLRSKISPFIRESEEVRGRDHAALVPHRIVSDDGKRWIAHGRCIVIDRPLFVRGKEWVPGRDHAAILPDGSVSDDGKRWSTWTFYCHR